MRIKFDQQLFAQLHPQTRIEDEKKGIVTYVASDETLDQQGEVIRADGWRFDYFKKNAPFVDTHDYSTLENLVGKVLDFKVKGRELEETVQWAIDVPENRKAHFGWAMTTGGYLKAVSAGFVPERIVTPQHKSYSRHLAELKATVGDVRPQRIITQQQQVELSACIMGINPNALAKAYA